MNVRSMTVTFAILAMSASPLWAQSKMDQLKDALLNKVEILAEEEVNDLSETNFQRLQRNMNRQLTRLDRDEREHIIDEWTDDDNDWDHVEECSVCNENMEKILRGTSLEWMVPDLIAQGLPRGTITLQCGCHGYTSFGARRANSACASGFDEAVACQGWCPAGGSPYGARCL